MAEKAENRNQDEFFFAMSNSRVANGRHLSEGQEALSADALKLMRTQDVGYVQRQLAVEASKIEKLKSSLHFIEASAKPQSKPRHTIFVDKAEDVKNFNAAQHFDTEPELVHRTYNRPTRQQLQTMWIDAPETGKDIKKLRKKREKAYRELKERSDRRRELKTVVEHMQVQRNLEGKGRRQKVKDAEEGKPAIYRWRKKRKR